MVINAGHEAELYKMLTKLTRDKKSDVFRVGGHFNHIHLFVNLHPTVSLSELVSHVKIESSKWMKRSGKFPYFEGWASEYFAEVREPASVEKICRYIDMQHEHHTNFDDIYELKRLYGHNNMEWTEYSDQ